MIHFFGAHVRDPIPLMNPVGPSSIADANAPKDSIANQVNQGGVVSVHLSPVKSPQPNSDDTRSMTMWEFHDASKNITDPQLVIYKGTSGNNPEILKDVNQNEQANRGAFKLDEDNLGYGLEYRVKWSWSIGSSGVACGKAPVLPTMEPLEPFVGMLNWSDRTGRILMAKLSDVLNPEQARIADPGTFFSWKHPELWGRAVFHRK